MGIKGLMKLIADHAPAAIKEREITEYFGRKVAIDASMCLYQFLIAVRSGPEFQNLTNEAGEVTSHLQGMFYRTIRMLDAGIKPVFVFDGKPPTMKKSNELAKRAERREEAEVGLQSRRSCGRSGRDEPIHKASRSCHARAQLRKLVSLLRLMGVPVIEAPGEAEAQCAQLVKDDIVWATGTEDMDALTFGSKRLLQTLNVLRSTQSENQRS